MDSMSDRFGPAMTNCSVGAFHARWLPTNHGLILGTYITSCGRDAEVEGSDCVSMLHASVRPDASGCHMQYLLVIGLHSIALHHQNVTLS